MYRPPSVSPDGRWIVLSQTGFDLVLVDVVTHRQVEVPGPGSPVVAWSPDSRHFAYVPEAAGVAELYVYDIQSGRTERLIALEEGGDDAWMVIRDVVWSPDSRYIAFACCFTSIQSDYRGDLVGEIWRLDVSSRQIEAVGVITTSVASNPRLCWAADGRLVVMTELAPVTHCSYTPLRSPVAISPDGVRVARLAPVSWDGSDWSGPSRLSVVEVATEQVLWQQELTINAKAVAWSPDGRHLVLDDELAHSPIWEVEMGDADGLEPILEDGFLLEVVSQWSTQPDS